MCIITSKNYQKGEKGVNRAKIKGIYNKMYLPYCTIIKKTNFYQSLAITSWGLVTFNYLSLF